MLKTRVGILRGGPSSEYDVSLKTGGAVLAALPNKKYEIRDVLIDKQGTWHMRGMPISTERALAQMDVAFLALHGEYGEDGRIQRLLESHAIPYTGSDSLSSALAMNKKLTKHRAEQLGARVPFGKTISIENLNEQSILELFRTFPQPCVIKPNGKGSSVGVTIALDYNSFLDGIEQSIKDNDEFLIEEYITGREATCGVLDSFRDEDIYALPDIEIIPNKEQGYFDYAAKYEGASKEICPGTFDRDTKSELARLAKLVHKELGLRHYSRSDFIVSKRGIYFLEVNTLPGLTEASLLPQAVQAVGCSFPDFLEHLVGLAMKR